MKSTIQTNSRTSLILESIKNAISKEDKTKYANQVWTMLQKSYEHLGGYKSHIDINDMIKDSTIWKIDQVNDHVFALLIYKGDLNGLRKIVGLATDSTPDGVKRLVKILDDDFSKRKVFVEASGPFKKLLDRNFAEYKIPHSQVQQYLGGKTIKKSTENDFDYSRIINGEPYTKTVYGSPI